MSTQKFQETLKTIPMEKPLHRVTAGWLLLVGRKAEKILEDPEPTVWRTDDLRRLQFYDWMAWHAGKLGNWEEAFRVVDAELHRMPLPTEAPWGFLDGYSIEELRKWLKENWEEPPEFLSAILAHPKLLESTRAAHRRYDAFMKSLGAEQPQ